MGGAGISFTSLITGQNKGKKIFENLCIGKVYKNNLGIMIIMIILFKCSYLQGDKCYPMYNGAIAKMLIVLNLKINFMYSIKS